LLLILRRDVRGSKLRLPTARNIRWIATTPVQHVISSKWTLRPLRCRGSRKPSWEYGPFVNWGTGVGDRSDYKFFWGGFELGKVLTPVVHAGIFSGQFQFAGNIMPLWQAYTPAPHEQAFTCDPDADRARTRVFADWRRHLYGRQPYAGDLSLELSDQVAADSALVSGCGRADLHHAQVSAEF
jgi:hypothetical protein